MKNVNINGFVCESFAVDNERPSFNGITDVLKGEKKEDGIIINNFNVIVLVNIIQSREEEELFTNYECSMRITSFMGKTTEITRFKLSDNIQKIEKEEGVICRNFAVNKFFLSLKNYIFPDGEGRYILKILIRKKNELNNAVIEKDTQFMMPIYIMEEKL